MLGGGWRTVWLSVPVQMVHVAPLKIEGADGEEDLEIPGYVP
jgi:hypothetical protein